MSALDMLKADVNILVMVFVAVTLPSKSRHQNTAFALHQVM